MKLYIAIEKIPQKHVRDGRVINCRGSSMAYEKLEDVVEFLLTDERFKFIEIEVDINDH